MKHGGETVGRPARPNGHQRVAGFLLDRIRRRARPRNRQTRKSLCQPWTRRRYAEPSRDWFWPYRHRRQQSHTGASSTVPYGFAGPLSLEQTGCPPARSIGVKGHERRTFTAIRRNNGSGIFSTMIGRACGLGSRRRRIDDQSGTGSPATSCANRSGKRPRISRCCSAVAPPHSPISATVRPQPLQSPARASSAQTATQGD